jgi:hypothetical protein
MSERILNLFTDLFGKGILFIFQGEYASIGKLRIYVPFCEFYL